LFDDDGGIRQAEIGNLGDHRGEDVGRSKIETRRAGASQGVSTIVDPVLFVVEYW
jgi:hypothetical protein